jgi:hypothetical protein
MARILDLCYQCIPSFKREGGGLHRVYVAVHSRIYASRMRYLHRRGRHGKPWRGLDRRCSWCGRDTEEQR